MAIRKVTFADAGTCTEAVYPVAQLRSVVQRGSSRRPSWGTGFVVADRGRDGRGLMITAAHVINGKGEFQPTQLRVDFRAAGGNIVHVNAASAVWLDEWADVDFALVSLAAEPPLLERLTLTLIEDTKGFDGEVYGYDPKAGVQMCFAATGGARAGTWLAYDRDLRFPGFSGGPVTARGGLEVFGVHTGFDGRRKSTGAAAITNELLTQLEDALWS